MSSRLRHPGADALIRWYLAERGLDALDSHDEAVVRHVASCPACQAEYNTLCVTLDEAADDTRHVADAVFSPEHLVQQRERILRRIEGHGARVLSFPAHEAAARVPATHLGWKRWVAVAAAAGLVVGVLAGRLLHLTADQDAAAVTARLTARPAATASAGHIIPAGLTHRAGDETFMLEVDTALSAPRTPELEAIDAMTLRVQNLRPRR